MANPGPGRPRVEQRTRRGRTPRAEILDAAGELFTTKGYATTSTRAVADAVGIRQASLYHHFAAKDDILDALLAETITGPLALAARLIALDAPAPLRLYTLARYDVRQLCAAHWNLGALYLLPEVRAERFAPFRTRRDELRRLYEQFANEVVTGVSAASATGVSAASATGTSVASATGTSVASGTGTSVASGTGTSAASGTGATGGTGRAAVVGSAAVGPSGDLDGACTLPFRLVETVIGIRSDEGAAPAHAERSIPDAALRILGWAGDLDVLRRESADLIARLTES